MSRYMMNKFIRAVEMSTANVNATSPTPRVSSMAGSPGERAPMAAADDRVLTPEERTAFVERDYGALYGLGAHPYLLWHFTEASLRARVHRGFRMAGTRGALPRRDHPARRGSTTSLILPHRVHRVPPRRGFAGPAAHRFRGTSVGRIRPRAVRAGTCSLHPSALPTGGPPGASARARRMPRGWGFPRGIRPICAGVARRGERGLRPSSMCGCGRSGAPAVRVSSPEDGRTTGVIATPSGDVAGVPHLRGGAGRRRVRPVRPTTCRRSSRVLKPDRSSPRQKADGGCGRADRGRAGVGARVRARGSVRVRAGSGRGRSPGSSRCRGRSTIASPTTEMALPPSVIGRLIGSARLGAAEDAVSSVVVLPRSRVRPGAVEAPGTVRVTVASSSSEIALPVTPMGAVTGAVIWVPPRTLSVPVVVLPPVAGVAAAGVVPPVRVTVASSRSEIALPDTVIGAVMGAVTCVPLPMAVVADVVTSTERRNAGAAAPCPGRRGSSRCHRAATRRFP